MPAVTLYFSTQTDPLSALIRACTWSQWSHVSLMDHDGYLISAEFPLGVYSESVSNLMQKSKRVHAVTFETPQAGLVVDKALSQMGKPYDLSAVIGIGLHRDWQEDDSWFCSELIAWAFDQAGTPLFRREAMHRVTPEHLWMLAPGTPL